MLFEEKLRDKRFYQAERAIFTVCLEGKISDVDVLARKAGVSRATFYRHHGSVGAVAGDYEELLRVRLERKFGRMEGVPIRKIYQGLLFFVLQNRDLFDFLVARGRKSPFYLLMESVKGAVSSEKRLLGDEMIYQVYAAEIVAVLEMWAKRGFEGKEMEMVLENILYLTRTAGIRLGPLKEIGEKDK